MKIKTLIEELLKLDQESEIYIKMLDSNYFTEFNISPNQNYNIFSRFDKTFDLHIPCSENTIGAKRHYVISMDPLED